MWGALASILTAGTGGGLIGTVAGLFKQSRELKHEARMEEIRLERDREDRLAREAEREHEIDMLDKRSEAKTEQVKVETEAQAEIEALRGRGEAQTAEFSNLDTSQWMDNFRASVRPTLAYGYSLLFTALLCWAFAAFHDQITQDHGAEILLGLFTTLEFAATSAISFYFAARRKSAHAPRQG